MFVAAVRCLLLLAACPLLAATARLAVGEVTEVAIDSDNVQGGREVVQRVQKIEVRTKTQCSHT